MFRQPDWCENISVRLLEVLADVGVDERTVKKRRRTFELMESISSIYLQLLDLKSSVYYMGSQSEGTTTQGLSSDTDILQCHSMYNVIQDWSQWKPRVRNLLILQDETVSPGYCHLQQLRGDVPLPFNHVTAKHYFRDRTGKILLSNTFSSDLGAHLYRGAVRNGPAYTVSPPGTNDVDEVPAYYCETWPLQARQWLDYQGQWPSDDIRRYCRNTGCLVVPVGSKTSENEKVEWRVSTSLAERCLIFQLNITQIRCYVLMKMLLKTFFKQPLFKDTISSFMCKTMLFHCIANTHSNIWRENNLLACLSLYLSMLYHSILNENCPHFIIPGNNLMRGKISPGVKPFILDKLRYIINSEGRAILEIECDDLGSKLLLKLNNFRTFKTCERVSSFLAHSKAMATNHIQMNCLYRVINSSCKEAIQTLLKYISSLFMTSNQCQGVKRTACHLLATRLCASLGSALASFNTEQHNAIPAEALMFISLGLITDFFPSKLKLASTFYYLGDNQNTDIVLRDIGENYDLTIVEPICGCYDFRRLAKRRFNAISDNQNEGATQFITASCIRFLPHEINIIPTELQYEIVRSTQEDLAYRGRQGKWMDCAVVDSLPYLYFLQYKTYSRLERQHDKEEALSNLVRTIDQEQNLGHRETALNLLGQCMEAEYRYSFALNCYSVSLHLRERNNAAKIHICRLLSSLINNH